MSQKYAVSTENAPSAIGPYSQAMRAGNFLFISGQVALDPKSGQIVGETIEEQCLQLFKNLDAILKSEGLSPNDIVKNTVFLKDMNAFKSFNALYQEFVQPPYPARSTIEVSRLPLDVHIEIETIACYPS